jgi:predicted ATPase/class 3 adenylate cyclase
MVRQPSGTVTFLFTDIEGSTRLLQQLGPDRYAESLDAHRRLLRAAFSRHGGYEVNCEGDSFFVAFQSAAEAVTAAAEAQGALDDHAWPGGLAVRVRMGIHTGEPVLAPPKYVGLDIHRAARLMAAGHGGQALVSGATAALAGIDGLRDLGEHRFKDLSAPERVYQLGDADFPSLRSLHRTNLPVPTTPFFGREKELGEVVALLTAPDLRLLTLTGPGGTGKTRLAAQAAGLASGHYPDGVYWVSLAAVRDPDLVLREAANAVGSKNGLADHIGGKRLLLLLDNLEQVLEAADPLAGLISACPNLRLLTTSREPLRLSGEQEYPVPPLSRDDAIGFFVTRARAIRPDFQPDGAVPDICERLDDLPLALELGAARIKALSTKQILARLDDRLPLLTGGARDLPPRQRTLRAAIEWSYELLTESDQQLFRKLSVFVGGCSLEAAIDVCDADVDSLQSLVEKNLLRFSYERYWMLESIREYAFGRLAEAGEAEAFRERHAEWLTAAWEAIGDPWMRLTQLDAELNNFRAACRWFTETGQAEALARLASESWIYFHLRAPEEGRALVTDALALTSEESPVSVTAQLLLAQTVYSETSGDYTSAERFARECLDLSRRISFAQGEWRALLELGLIASAGDRFDQARRFFTESETVAAREGSRGGMLDARTGLADLALQMGDFARAETLSRELLPLHDLDDASVAVDFTNIAFAAAKLGNARGACEAVRASLEVMKAHGPTRHLRNALEALAFIIVSLDRSRAATLLAASNGLEPFFGHLSPFEATVHRETQAVLDEAGDKPQERRQHESSLNPHEALAVGVEACEWLEESLARA